MFCLTRDGKKSLALNHTQPQGRKNRKKKGMSAGYQPSTTLSVYADWAYYPVKPELRCGACGNDKTGKWLYKPPGGGCQYRAHYLDHPPTVACKNGAPYDCKCNLIQEPYSMAYEAKWPGCTNPRTGCKKAAGRCRCPASGPGTYFLEAPYFLRET